MLIIFCFYLFIRFDRPLYKGEISENTPPGEIVVTVKAVDKDPGPYGSVNYEILGLVDRESFKIDEKGMCIFISLIFCPAREGKFSIGGLSPILHLSLGSF